MQGLKRLSDALGVGREALGVASRALFGSGPEAAQAAGGRAVFSGAGAASTSVAAGGRPRSLGSLRQAWSPLGHAWGSGQPTSSGLPGISGLMGPLGMVQRRMDSTRIKRYTAMNKKKYWKRRRKLRFLLKKIKALRAVKRLKRDENIKKHAEMVARHAADAAAKRKARAQAQAKAHAK